MKAPAAFPVEIKRGNTVVKIYRVQNGDYSEFRVAWRNADGKRQMKYFADFDRAKSEASKVTSSFAPRAPGSLILPASEAAIYQHALEMLKPTGAPLARAIEFYVKHNPRSFQRKSVSEVQAEMIEAKRKDGASAVYLKDLDVRLGKFVEAFQCRILDVTTQLINDWLRTLPGSGRSRNNYRRAVGTLFKFAVAAGYVSKDHLDLDQIATAREAHAPIEIFTPAEMVKLLQAAQINTTEPGWNLRYVTGQGLLPYLLLGGFAGLRTAEIQRQRWSDINLDRGFIRVTAAKGNTAQKRLVPISDNLSEWLALCCRDEGTCCDYGRIEDAVKRLSERAGVKWKHNALRHSFISYRVAFTQNLPQVSLEAANSVQMVNRHYRELVTEAEAKAWFSICPKAAENVVPMAKTA